jgi:broad specificity phosphatase PhoE
MKEVQLRRHAEKSPNGTLTQAGIRDATELRKLLPNFVRVVSSPSERTIDTAKLITNTQPDVDERASYYTASQEKSDAINILAAEQGTTFLEAVQAYNDPEVLSGIENKARELNDLIAELLGGLADGEVALIVSHDITISPAMAQNGIPLESIAPLGGYVIDEQGNIKPIE